MSYRGADSVDTDCVKVAVRGSRLCCCVTRIVRPLVARERGCADIAVLADSERNEVAPRFAFHYYVDIDKGQRR